MSDMPLYYWSARDLARAIRSRELSAVEVMESHLDRIDELNPTLNCIVQQISRSEALEAASQADRAIAGGDEVGLLHGLPTAVKDLLDVQGLRTTFGSAARADAKIAPSDCLLAQRLKEAGAIIIGKTNTPEYGVGTLTYNPVYGRTRNPWDLERHGGGSSSAASAIAAGLLPLADGSDSGGSLRYPSAFCNTVGLRPTAGMIPSDAPGDGWSPHSVLGPMARSSADARMYAAAVSGRFDAAPLSYGFERAYFEKVQPLSLRGVRIAWSGDLGGLPIDDEISEAMSNVRRRLQAEGAEIVDREIDYHDVDDAWEIIEMFGFYAIGARDVESDPGSYGTDFTRNVRVGGNLSAQQLAWALDVRTDVFRRTASLFREVDLIVTPATPVTAPPLEENWVREVGGATFRRYFEWQRCATRATLMSHPVLVTPGGFTESGMPFGLQVIGPAGQDSTLLAYGEAIENVIGAVGQFPSFP